jgi:hypothetical protein
VGKFKVALRKYFNAHPFYSVNELFKCKDNLLYCFVNLFIVIYTVKFVYLFHILPSLLTHLWVHDERETEVCVCV